MKNIRLLKSEELSEFLGSAREKPFRLNQILEWLWKYRVTDFDEMTNIPGNLRKVLRESFIIDAITIDSIMNSSDGTLKILFELTDKISVEGVIIPSGERVTACISSQAGCPLGCRFCATGHMGFKRNLSNGEIFDQAFLLNRISLEKWQLPLSNIVIMGMGEPLLNYENVMNAVEHITSENGMELAKHRITLSTAGIPDKIKKMADDGCRVNLAFSLHSAKNEIRNELLPFSKKYSLEMLSEALQYYTSVSKQKVTVEYLLLNGINDSVGDAKELIRFCSRFDSKINLIEYNPVPELDYQKSGPENTALFLKTLQGKNIISKIRKSRGGDIAAACGQLANKVKKQKNKNE